MLQNGSAQISGKYKQSSYNRVSFDVYVKYIVAREVFNPNEQSFSTGGYVAPGKYKVWLVSITRVPGGGGGPMGCSRDLTECERYVQENLIDYNPDGWQPSDGMIIDYHVRTNADTWDEDHFF
jgi:hypothetical protein